MIVSDDAYVNVKSTYFVESRFKVVEIEVALYRFTICVGGSAIVCGISRRSTLRFPIG